MHSHLCSMCFGTHEHISSSIVSIFRNVIWSRVRSLYPEAKLSVFDSVNALIDVFKLRNVDVDEIVVVIIIAVDVDALLDDDGEEIQNHLNVYWNFICKFYDN